MELKEKSSVPKVIIKCNDCLARFENIQWAQGTPCPKCGSKNFFPATIIGDAVDYSLADRRKGPAIEDVRFGRLAVWSGLIKTEQYSKAIKKQKELAQNAPECPPIDNVLIQDGALTQEKVLAILDVLCKQRPDRADIEFGQLAVRNNFATQEQLDECREIQSKISQTRHEVPPIGLLMAEKKYLPESRAIAILKAQLRSNRGILHDLRQSLEAYQATGKKQDVGSVLAGKKGVLQKRNVLLAIGLLILVPISFWVGSALFGRGGGSQPPIPLMCRSCKAVYMGRATAKFPQKCKKCGQLEVYKVVKCTKCGEFYTVKSLMTPEPCPKCKLYASGELTKDDFKRLKEKYKK